MRLSRSGLAPAAERRLRLAQARAEETLIDAHVANALMFIDALAEDLSFDRAIEQLRGAVQAIWVLQLWQVEPEIGPERARRQVVAREGIEMSRMGWHGHRSFT